ncbi:MAG: tetratricopeptide repeat protein, partial [Acidobacteria bacterium]|nr:tetratricopeptide repeat protein [Acidobacteriota bacterium]
MPLNKIKSSSVKQSKLIVISVILSVTIGTYFNANVLANPIKFIQNPIANNSNEKGELALGKEVEQELSGESAHSYSVKLEANQYLNLVVEQKGIDIVATVFSPSGEKIYEVDSPNGTEGDEPIYLITQSSGTYRLEVRSLDKSAPVGKYQTKIVELRASVPLDAERVVGFKAFGEAVLLEGEGKVDLAITKHLDAIEKFDKTSEFVYKANALNELANLYYNNGNHAKAEPFYVQALDIRRKVLGDNHLDTSVSLNGLGFLYYSKGDYTKAEPFYIQALDIRKKSLGDNHPDTATILNNLGLLYNDKGDYTKAEPFYIQALDIRKKSLGNNHPNTILSFNRLATLYENMGEYSKAESIYIQALDISGKVFDNNNIINTAGLLNNLALLYSKKGEYSKVEPLYIQALDIFRKASDNYLGETASVLNNLADFYSRKGEYSKAEPLFAQSLDIFRKLLGDEHPNIPTSINNLAILFQHKGDYSKAESLFSQALGIRKKVLGDSHPDTANSLNNLANLYLRKREDSKAESLFSQALEIRKKALGDSHPDTADSINSLAVVYDSKGDYSNAELLYIQALEIRKKVLGDSHPKTANSLSHLANFYLNRGEYEKAETLYIKALDIYRKDFGDNHPDTTNSLNNLANLYSSKGDYEKAVKYFQEASDAREVELTRNLALGSERQKQLYLQLYANETDVAVSLHVKSAPTSTLAKKLALTQILRRKGRTIDAVNQSVEALRTRSKPEDVLLLDELASKKAFFSNLTIQGLGKLSPDEYQKLLKSLQDEIEKLEYKISEKSAEFRSQSQPITLEAVQKTIPKDSVLVEFASYRDYDSKTREYGVSRYVVYLLDREGNINWADLGEAEVIDELVVELREQLRNRESNVIKD